MGQFWQRKCNSKNVTLFFYCAVYFLLNAFLLFSPSTYFYLSLSYVKSPCLTMFLLCQMHKYLIFLGHLASKSLLVFCLFMLSGELLTYTCEGACYKYDQ